MLQTDGLQLVAPDTICFANRSWGRSSVGRAPALQAGCHRFESVRLHQVLSRGRVLLIALAIADDWRLIKVQKSKLRAEVRSGFLLAVSHCGYV